MKKAAPDPVMLRVQELLAEAGLSMDELGKRMGYEGDVARKSAWQFVRTTKDPRLSMLRRFAKAVGVKLRDLFPDE